LAQIAWGFLSAESLMKSLIPTELMMRRKLMATMLITADLRLVDLTSVLCPLLKNRESELGCLGGSQH